MTVEIIHNTITTLIITISYLHAHHPLLFCKVSTWLQSASTRIFIYNTWDFFFCSNTVAGRKAQNVRVCSSPGRDRVLQEARNARNYFTAKEKTWWQKNMLRGKSGKQKKAHGRKKNFAVKRKRGLGGWVKFSKCNMGLKARMNAVKGSAVDCHIPPS